VADFQGQDPQDTMARQMAALSVLRLAIEDRAGPRRWHALTPGRKPAARRLFRGGGQDFAAP
jgi:hypothetical protein